MSAEDANEHSHSESESEDEKLEEAPRIYGIVYEITSPHLTHSDGRLKKYIGSTNQTLQERFRHHKNLKVNTSTSRFIIEAGDATAKILECGLYADKHAMHVRERYYIEIDREIVVNINIPSNSRSETNRNYLSRNRETVNSKKREKVLCELCNKSISRSNLATHKASDLHLNNLSALKALRDVFNKDVMP